MTPTDTFEQHAHDIYAWAFRLLGRHHDALDVVQDVFIRWDAQCRAEPPAQPRGWLRRVTLNRAIDSFRRRDREPTATADANAFVLHRADEAEQRALRADIAAAMAALTEAQRSVLIAKVYDGLTFAAIAAEAGLSASTVKTHYLRAIRAVRDRLSPDWAERTTS